MIKLEEMGTILMHIALQYTHPDFESMYSDWSTVHDIGEKLVKMSDQPQLNENQQIAINNAKKSFEKGADIYDCAIDMMLYDGLTDKEWAKATVTFLLWAQEQEEG
ncbi:hypothetical protein I6I79_00605 [Enterococcus casseliflavus]|uniref:hypothetical protein n=1 Tax=Enterococcus casseliflavus TaxID=37734 RepID=UPI00191AC9C3|nr:hypothetical protein [Enterococcus casseliflavus]QQU16527.1 hypothetical protein I6I79_00605 [Enterococcus casseliflavus]